MQLHEEDTYLNTTNTTLIDLPKAFIIAISIGDMNRRTVLAGCALSTTLAGCLDGISIRETDDGGKEYTECHLVEISYEWFPGEIKSEVDTALEEGVYEAERVLFAEAVDIEKSYLVVDNTSYEPHLQTEAGTQRLELTEVDDIRAPEPYEISVRNWTDEKLDVNVELLMDEPIINENFTLWPGQGELLKEIDRFAPVDASVEVLTGEDTREANGEFEFSDRSQDGRITIREDTITFHHLEPDVNRCSWDVTPGRFLE